MEKLVNCPVVKFIHHECVCLNCHGLPLSRTSLFDVILSGSYPMWTKCYVLWTGLAFEPKAPQFELQLPIVIIKQADWRTAYWEVILFLDGGLKRHAGDQIKWELLSIGTGFSSHWKKKKHFNTRRVIIFVKEYIELASLVLNLFSCGLLAYKHKVSSSTWIPDICWLLRGHCKPCAKWWLMEPSYTISVCDLNPVVITR